MTSEYGTMIVMRLEFEKKVSLRATTFVSPFGPERGLHLSVEHDFLNFSIMLLFRFHYIIK